MPARIPYFRYYKTHLYLFFSVFVATYNQDLEDFYLISKYFRGVFYSNASSIQKRLIIAKIRYFKTKIIPLSFKRKKDLRYLGMRAKRVENIRNSK